MKIITQFLEQTDVKQKTKLDPCCFPLTNCNKKSYWTSAIWAHKLLLSTAIKARRI